MRIVFSFVNSIVCLGYVHTVPDSETECHRKCTG